MSAAWGAAAKKASDRKIRDVVDKLLYTRFWDKGHCKACGQDKSGIFEPTEHAHFYCKDCWFKHLSSLKESEWAEWEQWKPKERVCLSESSQEHEMKCVLLALSRFGGSVTFPPSLSSWLRRKSHLFCEQEEELKKFTHKSYSCGGSGVEDEKSRFLRISSEDPSCALPEAVAVLLNEPLESMSTVELESLRAKFDEEISRRTQSTPAKPERAPLSPLAAPASEEDKQDYETAPPGRPDASAAQQKKPSAKPLPPPPRPPGVPAHVASPAPVPPARTPGDKDMRKDDEAASAAASCTGASAAGSCTGLSEQMQGQGHSGSAKPEFTRPTSASTPPSTSMDAGPVKESLLVQDHVDFPPLGADDDFPTLGSKASAKKKGKNKK